MRSDYDSPASPSTVDNDSPSRILILTASVGAGHNQAARALQETLRRSRPQIQVECWDVLDYTSRLFRLKYISGYAMMVSKFPWLYGMGYAITDRPRGPKRTLMEKRRLWSEARSLKALGQAVDAYAPDRAHALPRTVVSCASSPRA